MAHSALLAAVTAAAAPRIATPITRQPLRRMITALGAWAAVLALIALALPVSPALGNDIPLAGTVNNGEVQYDWEFHMDVGAGNLAISNIGTTPLTLFELDIAELTQYWSDPDVWDLNPPSGTWTFSITGSSLINGESLLIDYEFNKNLVQLIYADFGYQGADDIGTLNNIVTVGPIPEPSTVVLLAVGAPLLLRRRCHRRARP